MKHKVTHTLLEKVVGCLVTQCLPTSQLCATLAIADTPTVTRKRKGDSVAMSQSPNEKKMGKKSFNKPQIGDQFEDFSLTKENTSLQTNKKSK